MATETATPKATKAIVAPFGIEADEARNGDILIQNIPDCRLRSRIIPSRPVIVNKSNKRMPIPADQAKGLGAIGEQPGMRLYVDPGKLEYKIIDPFHDDEALLDNLTRALKDAGQPMSGKLNGVPPRKGKLTPDQMKTLVREMAWLLISGDARLIAGPCPYEVEPEYLGKDEEIKAAMLLDAPPGTDKLKGVVEMLSDDLPGDYLLNPRSKNYAPTQPLYEKDLSVWAQGLNRVG